MSDAKPFRGYRPRSGLINQVASPPYDVMNEQEAREMAAGNPLSFLHVVRAEIDLAPGVDVHSDEVYEKSAGNLQRLIDDGVLIRDKSPCFYIYQLTMGKHVQRGLMAGVSVSEYEEGLIKKHEFTRMEKEDDRARHVDLVNANTGPVMITYKARPEIDGFIDQVCSPHEPVYDFNSDDGIRHTMWVVSDAGQVERLQDLFGKVGALYIADGHHRSAAAYRVRNLRKERNPKQTGSEAYNYFLGVLFPDNQLQILGYYRAVKDLNGLSADEFIANVKGNFEVHVTDMTVPSKPRQFSMFLDGKWYRLIAREGTFDEKDPVERLDVAILQKNLLQPILGIDDPRTDDRIDFIGGIRGTKELEKRCGEDMKVAFALYPTTVTQLMDIADNGQVMPPKSTWFEPKLRSGMVVRYLD